MESKNEYKSPNAIEINREGLRLGAKISGLVFDER